MKNNLRFSLLALTGIAALGVAWRMFSLWQKEELWGHLPLFFFAPAWAFLIFLFWKRFTRHPKGLRWLGLSTLSGVLLAAGFPPLPLTPLMFVAWVPLLIVEHEISQERDAPWKGMLFKYGYHTFVLWNVLATWWVCNTAFVAAIVAIWVNSLFMIVPFLMFHHFKKRFPKTGYASLLAFWLSFEWLHLNWELSWSWLNLGNAFARFPSWIQWYEWTGTFGGSLWILGLNVLIFNILKKNDWRFSNQIWRAQKRAAGAAAALILLPVFVSLLIYFNQKDKGRDVEVVVVQPNFEPHYEKFEVPEAEQIQRFFRLSASAITEKTEYLVWPETSFDANEVSDLQHNQIVREVEAFLRKYPKVKLVTGIGAYKVFKPGEVHTRHTRRSERGERVIFWEAYNAAIQLESAADSIPFYIKSKLVPGAELTPYPEVFFWLKPLVNKLGGSVEGLGNQPEREAFPSESGKVAPVVCYESVFGEYHAGYVRAGAEATFIMTNDGWWDNTAGHKQHLMFASLRAIETRRSIARSANTGISCFLNQRGDILQPTKYGVEAAIRSDVKFNDEITFYVRWGDLIGKAAVLGTLVFLGMMVFRRFFRRNSPKV